MTTTTAPTTGRYSSLDGLRGVFALAVMLFHANFASHFYGISVVRAAYLSVDFFFVLSGFVIAHAYAEHLGDGEGVGRFLIKRIGRVWPLHMATLAALVLLELVKLAVTRKLGIVEPSGMPFTGANSPYALVTNIFLLQSLDLHATTTWNYPSWSISAELVAYVLFALVCVFARRWALWAAAAIVVAATAIIVTGATNMDLTFHLGAIRGCLGFFAGWLAYAAFTRRSARGGTLLELALGAIVLGYLGVVGLSRLGFAAPFLFAAIIYLLAGSNGVVTRALNSRPLQFLGRISYSIYLVHAVVLIAIGLAAHLGERLLHTTLLVPAAQLLAPGVGDGKLIAVGGPWTMDALTLAYMALVIAIANLTWRYVEEPGRHAFARLAGRNRALDLRPQAS